MTDARTAVAGQLPDTKGKLALWLWSAELVNTWLDTDLGPGYADQPLAHTWARVTKVCEEAGEVWRALSAYTGENPRKGVCGTQDELVGELGDTAASAMFAIQHITRNIAETLHVIDAAIAKARARATGRPVPLPGIAVADPARRYTPDLGRAERTAGFRATLSEMAGGRLSADEITTIAELFDAEQARADGQARELWKRLCEYENSITWGTVCTGCARLLGAAYGESCRREIAEAALTTAAQAERERIVALLRQHAETVSDEAIALVAADNMQDGLPKAARAAAIDSAAELIKQADAGQ